ncbi:MAG: hypothetical protein RQ760_05270 [Sedimentisphaerales bacterium]|nr:hypothetical protein [Sedimentisphaerales bacterium]
MVNWKDKKGNHMEKAPTFRLIIDEGGSQTAPTRFRKSVTFTFRDALIK